MNASALRIEWDVMDARQIEEAKHRYRAARAEGRRICDAEGNAISSFKSLLGCIVVQEKELKNTEYSFRIFDDSGDRRIIWDCSDKAQVKEAANLFKEYLAKGWKVYAVDGAGKTGRRVFGFDEHSQELFVDERSTREKLDTFARNFKFLPKTFPG